MVLHDRFPDMPIFARAQDADHCAELTRLGATGIVPEIVEVSLQLGAQVLKGAGLAEEDVVRALADERAKVLASAQPMAPADAQATGGVDGKSG